MQYRERGRQSDSYIHERERERRHLTRTQLHKRHRDRNREEERQKVFRVCVCERDRVASDRQIDPSIALYLPYIETTTKYSYKYVLHIDLV